VRRALLVLGALLAPLAQAQDAIIDVPVRVADVDPSARVGAVSCAVFASADGPDTGAGYLGTGSKWFELKAGAHAGVVPVPVKFDAAGTARAYKCSLFLIFRNGDRARTLPVGRIVDPLANEYRDEFRRAPGAPFVPEVRGTFHAP
jgi:hypothetical protein